jgi:opacity protein-like surface antigen
MKTAVLAASAALLIACAHAADCPAPADVSQAHLLGTWQATIEGQAPVTLQLAKDPEFAETVRGHLERGGQRVELAGDVDEGDFTLEESMNGRNISATWLGEVVDGSCGREIRGTWKAEGAREERPFVLRKQ